MTRTFVAFGAASLILATMLGAVPSFAATTTSPGPARGGPALPAGVERVTSVEGITEYLLPNGLKVLLFPDPSKPTITVNVTYLVGSRQENYGETGMAHLLEHLMFKGSLGHPNVAQELTAHGAHANGTTNFDRTNYFETFTATEENLHWALDLESDRMVHSFIAKKDLDTEMTVVRNEYESGENNPYNVLIQRMFSTAYLSHSYQHPVIGARSDIENVPIERLQAYYHLYYQPDNAVLLVSGHIDESRTLAMVNELFGTISRPTRTLPVLYTIEPAQDGEREVELRRVGDTQMAAAGYHIPAASHPDFASLNLLGAILADTPSGRLYKALVESGKAASVFDVQHRLRDPGMLIFGASVPAKASADAARITLLSTVDHFSDTPPTSEELERARTELLKQIDLELAASDRFGIALSEWIAAGDWRLFFLHRDRLRAVTPADIQRVAAAYLKPSNRTTGIYLPTTAPSRAVIPASPDVAQMLRDYKGNREQTPGEAFDPSPSNIEAHTIRNTLRGGMKVALLPKKTRGGVVVVMMTLHLGEEQSLKGLEVTGSLCGQMLIRGTERHTRQQIQDEFNRLEANVTVGGGPTGAVVRIETKRERLPAVLKLVAEVLREPAFPAAELDTLKRARLAALAQQRTEPEPLATISLQRHLNPFPDDDVRYTTTLPERIDRINAVTLEQIKRFYQRFYGGEHGELAIVGDFDVKQIMSVAASLFGGWKATSPYARVPQVYQDATAQSETLQTPDKANALLLAGMNLQMRDDDPDYPAMVLANYLLGGGFISSRLATRVRQKEGLSYGIGSQFFASSQDRAGHFAIYAIYAPQNVRKVEAAIHEELERALHDGFTAEEVQAAKAGWLQSQQVSRAQDSDLVARLAGELYIGRTLAWDARLEEDIKALNPDAIVAALRRHVDPAKLTIIEAGDFSKG
jgi:zinc protease